MERKKRACLHDIKTLLPVACMVYACACMHPPFWLYTFRVVRKVLQVLACFAWSGASCCVCRWAAATAARLQGREKFEESLPAVALFAFSRGAPHLHAADQGASGKLPRSASSRWLPTRCWWGHGVRGLAGVDARDPAPCC